MAFHSARPPYRDRCAARCLSTSWRLEVLSIGGVCDDCSYAGWTFISDEETVLHGGKLHANDNLLVEDEIFRRQKLVTDVGK